jgi:hypothetical protein
MTLSSLQHFLLEVLAFVVVGYAIKVLCAEYEISSGIRNLILLIAFIFFIVIAVATLGVSVGAPLIR